jgi:hypothetical protein
MAGTVGTRHPEQDIQDRTAGTDSRARITGTGQPGQDNTVQLDRAAYDK